MSSKREGIELEDVILIISSIDLLNVIVAIELPKSSFMTLQGTSDSVNKIEVDNNTLKEKVDTS